MEKEWKMKHDMVNLGLYRRVERSSSFPCLIMGQAASN